MSYLYDFLTVILVAALLTFFGMLPGPWLSSKKYGLTIASASAGTLAFIIWLILGHMHWGLLFAILLGAFIAALILTFLIWKK